MDRKESVVRSRSEQASRWVRGFDALREGAASAFAVSPAGREACVRAMLTGHTKDRASYWLQLLVAMGIATLGLVLDSPAVVIGAMLVSPLISPIVEVGMGLSVGSVVLLSRSLLRTLASVLGVVAGAAVISLVLPFHEVTREITARTSPTVLDLFVAALCAVMAAYTALPSAASATATAAGAAIAIALVPPLSAVGWGLGTRHWDVMRGAALLFTANFCAIVLLTTLMFTVLGFNRVAVHELEEQAAEPARAGYRVAVWLRRLLGSRYGLLLRLVMPLVFVGAVFVPLRRALEEVVWQVRVRSDVQALIDRLAPPSESVHSIVSVASRNVTVRLVILGDAARASRIEGALRSGIAKVTEVPPTIDVVAVPDLAVLDKVAAEREVRVPATPAPSTRPDLDEQRRIVEAELASAWPESAAGPLLSWDLRVESAEPTTVDVVHFGAPIGPVASDFLGRDLTGRVGGDVVVVDEAISPESREAPPQAGAQWLVMLLHDARLAAKQPRLNLCVVVPKPGTSRALAAEMASVEHAVRDALAPIAVPRASIVTGPRWSTRLVLGPCEEPDGGIDADVEAPIVVDATAPDASAAPRIDPSPHDAAR